MSEKINIAIDAMGGDNAPKAVCLGAAEACRKFEDLNIILTGNKAQIDAELENINADIKPRISVVHAEEIISMNEHPAMAIRKKHKSSLRLAMEMVRSGEAQGCVSAGNTGAIVAGDRPAGVRCLSADYRASDFHDRCRRNCAL